MYIFKLQISKFNIEYNWNILSLQNLYKYLVFLEIWTKVSYKIIFSLSHSVI